MHTTGWKQSNSRYNISLALLLAPLDLLVMQGIHFDSQPFRDEMDF